MKPQPKKELRFFGADGRPLNVNQAKLGVTLTEDEDRRCLAMDVAVYRHLDTALIDVDVQPSYARVTVKGKALQVVFSEEVNPDASTAQRSSVTGHLVLTMPLARDVLKPRAGQEKTGQGKSGQGKAGQEGMAGPGLVQGQAYSNREYLEIGTGDRGMDFTRIVEMAEQERKMRKQAVSKKEEDDDFVDDPEVPPLE